MKKLKWYLPEELEIEYCNTLGVLRDNLICDMEDGKYILTDYEKIEYIDLELYRCTIYYEHIMKLYRALHFDGHIDIYELKSTNDQVIEALFDFFEQVIQEEDI